MRVGVTINGLQQACVQNEHSFVERIREISQHLSDVSLEMAAASRESFHDLSQIRDRFNELISNQLPETFANIQNNLSSLARECDTRFLGQESKLQEVAFRIQESSQYCQQLYGTIEGLRQSIVEIQARVRHPPDMPPEPVHNSQLRDIYALIHELRSTVSEQQGEFIRLKQDLSVVQKKAEISENVSLTCQQKIGAAENQLASMQNSCQTVDNYVQQFGSELQVLAAKNQDNFVLLQNEITHVKNRQHLNPNYGAGVPGLGITPSASGSIPPNIPANGLDFPTLLGQTNRVVSFLTDQVKLLDQTIFGINAKMQTQADKILALERAEVPPQRLQRIDEDMSSIMETLSYLESFDLQVQNFSQRLVSLEKTRETHDKNVVVSAFS